MKNKKSIKQSLFYSDLISGYLAGTLSNEQQIQLAQWLDEDVHNRELFEQLTNIDNLKADIARIDHLDEDSALQQVRRKIALHQEKNKQKDSTSQQLERNSTIWSSKLVAISLTAAALMLLIPTIWFYSSKKEDAVGHDVVVESSDIDAAKIGATLTLPNGKTIRLDEVVDGELVKEMGVSITKAADGQLVYEIAPTLESASLSDSSLNILTTARGETYSVKLPDGSIVKLNSASTLEYPMNFMRTNKRKVKLNGEAYFQVAHNANKPFVIEYKNQLAEVLGTEFNINAYDNEEETVTTLVKGSLRVNAVNNRSLVLKPGVATFFDGRFLTSSIVDVSEHIAWKDGKFLFNKTPFETIARQFSRWYNIDIEYVNNKVPKIKFSGEINRDLSLEAILTYFKELGIKFKLEKRKLIIG